VSDFKELVEKGDMEHVVEMVKRSSITWIEIRDKYYPIYIIHYGDAFDPINERTQFPYCPRLMYKKFIFTKAKKTNFFYLDEVTRCCIERKGGNVAEVKYLIDFFEMFEMCSIYFDRNEDAIYFRLIENNHLCSFRYSFNKNSDGELDGSNIKKINDNWLFIVDE
jgi:hypothetical protein